MRRLRAARALVGLVLIILVALVSRLAGPPIGYFGIIPILILLRWMFA